MMGKLILPFTRLLIKCFTVVLFVSPFQLAQNSNLKAYQYISSVPGSSMNMPETNIIIRTSEFINPATLSSNKIKIAGSKSGVHSFKIKLSDDDKTILINPDSKFNLGEIVDVYYPGVILNNAGAKLPGFDFQFKITETDQSISFK